MKIIQTISLLFAANEVQAAREPWGKTCTADSDCTTAYTAIKAPSCCGTATKDPNYKNSASKNYAKDGVTQKVCNYKYSKNLIIYATAVDDTKYTVTADDITAAGGAGNAFLEAGYTFICASDVKAAYSESLVASTVLSLASLIYYMQ